METGAPDVSLLYGEAMFSASFPGPRR